MIARFRPHEEFTFTDSWWGEEHTMAKPGWRVGNNISGWRMRVCSLQEILRMNQVFEFLRSHRMQGSKAQAHVQEKGVEK